MKTTIEMLNRMLSDGVIEHYAIGGAVGATFYLEPSATQDVDVFVVLPKTAHGALLTLEPIYKFLISSGCRTEGAHVVIGDWPVQFLPANDGLEQEALAEAVKTEVEGVSTWVMSAEHLVGIALRTGRAKDHVRIIQFLESGALNRDKLAALLVRHGLTTKWDLFSQKYLEER